jgi:phosphonate transport system substrate-binding protein
LDRRACLGFALLFAAGVAIACGRGQETVFRVAGIPDQNASILARRYEALTQYLSDALDVRVEYVPTVDYAATVLAFKRGDVQMAWFGGLTSVQARRAVPGSAAIAQRPRDARFHSKFIVQAGLDVASLEDLAGLSFTFGSESSTSGYLMPRFFLSQAGIDPDADFKREANFSGSHDKTWALVESGAFQVGALNEAVWDQAVAEGRVDTARVREFYTTPAYFDYNWTVRGDVDERFGPGFTDRVQGALLALDQSHADILDLFSAEAFIESVNDNYRAIEEVAKTLGIIEK